MHQDLQNRTRGIFGAEGCNVQAIIDPMQKLLTGTNPVRLARRMQPIEIDSADEHWQLVPKCAASSTVRRSQACNTARIAW